MCIRDRSEFDNIEDATKSLVAMGQAYKDLDKMTIVDKLNEVGNNYAISTDELATALQKSAATLSLMGNTKMCIRDRINCGIIEIRRH